MISVLMIKRTSETDIFNLLEDIQKLSTSSNNLIAAGGSQNGGKERELGHLRQIVGISV